MKNITDVMDIVLLILVLAIMLPFALVHEPVSTNLRDYGFSFSDDKTMKLAYGDTSTERYRPEGLTASELVLLSRTAVTPDVYVSIWRLPDGTAIMVSDTYFERINEYAALVRASLNPGERYEFIFNGSQNIWIVAAAD